MIILQTARVWLARNAIWLILLMAWFLALYRLDARTFYGDELGSLADATGVRQNPQAFLYFLFLRNWLTIGNSEFWLRFPSACFVAMNVALNFAAIHRVWSYRVAILTGLLLATSPFVLEYGQQVRFYTLFLFAASASLWACVLVLKTPTRRNLILWIVATLLMLTTHAMSFLVLLLEITALWFSLRLALRWKFGLVLAGAGALVLVALSPLRSVIFQLVAQYTDAAPVFAGSRGLAISQFAKIPLTFFSFTFGQNLYLLNLPLVIPGLVLYAAAVGLGLYKLCADRKLFLFIVYIGIAALCLLYVVLDALIPMTFAGAAPRYVIFLLPLYYFVAAVGISSFRRPQLVALLFLALHLVTLSTIWQAQNLQAGDFINWRAERMRLESLVTSDTLLIVEGRASGQAKIYFPPEWRQESFYQARQSADRSSLPDASRIILISANFYPNVRADLTQWIRQLETKYTLTDGWVQYPQFVYIFDRKPEAETGFAVDSRTGVLALPVEIFGLEFQDLRLPVRARLSDATMNVAGQFTLASGDASEHMLEFVPQNVKRIDLLTTLTDASRLPADTTVAELQVQYTNGQIMNLPLRVGRETCAWNNPEGQCQTGFSWQKRLALLGSQRYPEAWSDFTARLYVASFPLPDSSQIRALRLRRVPSQGDLSVWGIRLVAP